MLLLLLLCAYKQQELQVPFLSISAPEVVSGMSGESESKIRGLFNDAMVINHFLSSFPFIESELIQNE